MRTKFSSSPSLLKEARSINFQFISMYDIITFGSATRDIYLKSKKFLSLPGEKFVTGEGICLALGSKTEVEDILFFSGGGGTNTAVTFKNQGFKVAYCGMVGNDFFGNLIIEELKKLEIDAGFVRRTKIKPTNLSVFLAYPGKDRTILVYRGASDLLSKKDIPWEEIKNSRWFYLAPFSGKLADLTLELVDFAKKNKIKVAFNPGYNQLTLPKKILERILSKVDILILNREEASLLTEASAEVEKNKYSSTTKIPYQVDEVLTSSLPSSHKWDLVKEKEVFKKIDEMTKGIAIMTKGGEGVVVSDGKYLYRAASLKLKGVDGTGAGDAFGSGFVSGLIQENNIEYAIQLAMANSGYAITKWGAKEGLLTKSQKWPKVKVVKEKCSYYGLCLPK